MQFNKITDNNYIHIEGFMRTQLNLKGNELLVYAVIYGFSQDGKNKFIGSTDYLVELVGATRKTVMTTLQNLCDKNLIKKEKTGNYCSYFVNLEYIKECVKITHLDNNECVKITPQVCKNYTEECKNYTDECVKITHNNNNNNNKNNNKDYKKGNTEGVTTTKHKKSKQEKAIDKVVGKLEEYDFSDKVKDKIIAFYEDRIEKKDYPAENQLTMILNKLAKVSERKQLNTLENSISNGYKGIFLDNKKDEYDGIHIRPTDELVADYEKNKNKQVKGKYTF